MKNNCEKCKHWVQMEEHYGECVLYGFKHRVWSPADATCDQWDGDEDEG